MKRVYVMWSKRLDACKIGISVDVIDRRRIHRMMGPLVKDLEIVQSWPCADAYSAETIALWLTRRHKLSSKEWRRMPTHRAVSIVARSVRLVNAGQAERIKKLIRERRKAEGPAYRRR
mgnify:CR=1 FL=1